MSRLCSAWHCTTVSFPLFLSALTPDISIAIGYSMRALPTFAKVERWMCKTMPSFGTETLGSTLRTATNQAHTAMSRFHTLTVRDIRQETGDCVSVAFQVPQSLEQTFLRFQPGQHLALRATINGERIIRNYSICSLPEDRELRIAVKKVPLGKFSTFANERLESGMTLEAMPPGGHFHLLPEDLPARNYLGFAAGSGITPVYSILRSVLERQPNSTFTLLYLNRTPNSSIFLHSLSELKNRFMDRFHLLTLFSQEETDVPLLSGKFTAEKCRAVFSRLVRTDSIQRFFLCGPLPLLEQVTETLLGIGVEPNRIRRELFGLPKTAVPTARHRPADPAAGDPERTGRLDILLDGKTHHLSFDRTEAATVLELAHRHGMDLPFACKAGVCATCKARVKQGAVLMSANYGLAPEETAEGYVLTCQSVPQSSMLLVSFDE
ncbi:MAG: hypothetical protein RLY31_3150 [Bacteroidota bacterium]